VRTAQNAMSASGKPVAISEREIGPGFWCGRDKMWIADKKRTGSRHVHVVTLDVHRDVESEWGADEHLSPSYSGEKRRVMHEDISYTLIRLSLWAKYGAHGSLASCESRAAQECKDRNERHSRTC
jgi:hypothetical protein